MANDSGDRASGDRRSAGGLGSFPRVFWIANVMELFERAAYYGMNAVLGVYLTNSAAQHGLGFTEQAVGFLQSVVYAITYVIPILGGALADRYGYRRMLIFAFSLLAAGYFLTGQASAYGVVFVCLLVMATGSGLFKPIISGTIARTTTEANSGFGFGIYYWMINLGALVAPLVAVVLDSFSPRYIFLASALYCAAMLLPTVFLYRDPPKPKDGKSLRQVLGGAAVVLGDARFMLMICVYSCFWILYFQNFGSVLWFLRDFVDKEPVDRILRSSAFLRAVRLDHFHEAFVTSINAGTIVLLQIVVTRIVKNIKPLPTMVAGIAIGSLGFLFLAFGTNPWIFIAGIFVFSIGEMTTHPKYYSYVGLVAPADKKALYMGYAFLYGVIGSLVGSNLGGVLYENMMKPVVGEPGVPGEIRRFWLLFAVLGFVAGGGLVLYNRFFAEDTPRNRRSAHAIMLGVYSILVILGVAFLYKAGFAAAKVNYKTLVQAAIMLLLGAGGIVMSLRHRVH